MCTLLIVAMIWLLPAGTDASSGPAYGPVYGPDDPVYSFEFHDEPLERALYRISEKTGTDLLYESALTRGVMVQAVFRQQPLRDILDSLLKPEGLEARRIRTGIYVIQYSLRRNIPPPPVVPARSGQRVDGLRAEMMQPVPLPSHTAFDEPMSLSEIIRRHALPE